MVIGYNHLTPNPAPAQVRAPLGSQFLAPPTSHSHHPYRKPSGSEDDVMSLESSDAGSGNFSSHDSTSDRKQAFVRSSSGHSSPSHHALTPHLKSREPPSDSEAQSCDLLPRSHDTTPKSHDLEMPSPFGSDDYTSKIRYPNNSRILVRPLLDEDISLKGSSSKVRESSDARGTNKEPYYCDRSHFDQYQPKRTGTVPSCPLFLLCPAPQEFFVFSSSLPLPPSTSSCLPPYTLLLLLSPSSPLSSCNLKSL